MVSSYPVIYNLSVNVYRDITKKNKAWKEVSEIVCITPPVSVYNPAEKEKKKTIETIREILMVFTINTITNHPLTIKTITGPQWCPLDIPFH